ncbi:ankyrin repeat domain-containing protein [Rhodococcus sp. IEGM 1330]|uniref:ankyrin repeat domain-containing protein n=1 Tax=Rhodococcus sp. IEGM 1330 TaxID=3082225 RepID=UPI002953C6A5|nr:ankyrin repeat domain-containing protein [Rhodococcus sp. IEGM 1330]MDV8022729.1 ankyrin repeat domain-containing protein [Rhodococcus sp. IEGM 1330]
MSAQQSSDSADQVGVSIAAALATGTREAFTALLAEDVRWGGERRGTGHECITREQAGDHYAGLLASGMALRVADIEPTGSSSVGDVFTARMTIAAPSSVDVPPEMLVQVTIRDGLIADISIMDEPPSIEVLYFDGCPHYELFLPHLRQLLEDNAITAAVTLSRIDNNDQAQARQFRGSPSVRVDGHDIEPDTDPHSSHDAGDIPLQYGMQCRLYDTADGTTGIPPDQWILDALVDNLIHESAVAAIHSGDVEALQRLLAEHTELASVHIPRREGRTLLHVATDWPGHFPDVGATVGALIAAGADPNSRFPGEHRETPLHWAASSDDVDAIDALLDAGADIDARGAVIAGGTPLSDATAFGQWSAARRLVQRGATTTLFDAAALGLVAAVDQHLETEHPTHESITSSFWGACHGGHVATAAVLLDHGADIDWIGYDGLTPLGAARRSEARDMIAWLEVHNAADVDPSIEPT